MKVNKKLSVQIICSLFSFLILFSGCTKIEAEPQSESIATVITEQTESTQDIAGTLEISYEADITEDNQSIIVYITKTGKKYHRDGCQYLFNSKIPIDLSELNTKKYTPCSVCKPTAQQ